MKNSPAQNAAGLAATAAATAPYCRALQNIQKHTPTAIDMDTCLCLFMCACMPACVKIC